MTRSSDDQMLPIDQLDRFVRAVHRRLVVVRALEGAGVGVIVASALAAMVTGAAIYLGKDASMFAAGAVAVGALAGLVWASLSAPSRLATAAEADRQLGLADLLSTALS